MLLRKVRDRGTRSPARNACATQAFVPLADAPCSILRRRARRENRDSGRSAPWRRKPRSDVARHPCCANGLRNVFVVLKPRADVALGE